MQRDFNDYLKQIKFEKQLKNLQKKLKNKNVVLYGMGSLFQYAKENYDLSFMNVIGVADAKFYAEEDKEFLGYKVIDTFSIKDYKPDYLIISTLEYEDIIDDFDDEEVYNKNKMLPLFKKPFLYVLKEFFVED